MFNEENTVERMVSETLCGSVPAHMVVEDPALYGKQLKGWKCAPADQLPRQYSDVFVEPMVRDALVLLNPEIKTQPYRATIMKSFIVCALSSLGHIIKHQGRSKYVS